MTNPNVFPHQPEFVDNRGDNTLAAALIARIEHLCSTLRASAFDAWERARHDIIAEWAKASEPVTLQPQIHPIFRQAAEHPAALSAAGNDADSADIADRGARSASQRSR